jgi:hypothetical protein
MIWQRDLQQRARTVGANARTIPPGRSRNIREVLEALEWVRKELMRKGSPDFIRQRQCQEGVKQLIAKMLRP